MLTGGVCVLDEGNRMNEKSWASLAPLFDQRRYVESIVAGITIKADANFRAAVTMNQDESTFEIPDYILSRLQPTLSVGFPDKQMRWRYCSITYHSLNGDVGDDGRVSATLARTSPRLLTA